MADLDIVKKRNTNTWVWVVLAIVAIAIIWMIVGRRSTTTTTGQHLERPSRVESMAVIDATSFRSAG